MRNKSIIAITSDMDWAPDEIINHFLSIVNDFGVRVTFFCTHSVNIEGKHELSVHPDYKPEEPYGETLKRLLNLFPMAKGVRNHGLFYHGSILPIFSKHNIKYISNSLMYRQSHINPFLISKDVLELPIYFMDDKYLHFGGRFQLDELDLSQPGLKIFGFHPIHIFLNTNSLEVYESAKKYYQQPKQLENYKNHNRGIKDLFIELLSYIRENEIPTYTLGEVNDLWRQNRLELDGSVKDRGTYD